jgi:putative ABC transport system substrate-binding protein
MTRRKLLIAFAIALALPAPSGRAQGKTRLPVIGVLVTHAPATDEALFGPFRDSLGKLGYAEGRSVTWRIVSAEGHLDKLPALARELVDEKVDVIIATNELSTRAAKSASDKLPIVMIGWGSDPVQEGFIRELSHPGGNITGTYAKPSGMDSKRLEILRETVPALTRVTVITDPALGDRAVEELRQAAQTLGVRLKVVEVRNGDDLESAFLSARHARAGAIIATWSPVFYLHRQRIASLSLKYKIPVVTPSLQGGVITYSADNRELPRLVADYVDRILKGASPRDLPVQEISTTRLVVDLRLARALGITVPQSILVRADKIFQ